MMLLAMLACCGAQDPLAAVAASEASRVAVIERCSAAVCSVMSMDSPGGGSGVVFDPIGLVLTNYHVVGQPDEDYKPPEPPEPPPAVLDKWRRETPGGSDEEAEFIATWKAEWRAEHLPVGKGHYKNKKVGLPDGRLYEGVVLGIDPGSDLAVLRLLPKEAGQRFPSCTFGDSDQLLVGETVFAMGNPFLLATDFTPTVTFGIVSGTHRYQEGQGNRMLVYPDCIQVDAPVNPGNSGGPLFNEAGEIIGINGRISIGDRGRVNVGVGFAIAANQIKNFLGDLIAGRHAEHGTLDMSAWFMTSRDGKEHKRGVFVQQLYRDSVVAAAGVGLGDELTWFNGTEIRSANQLATLIGVLPAETWVTLRHKPVLADGGFGEERQVTVKLTKLDTGSSQDGDGTGDRMASRSERRLAAQQLVQRWTAQGGEGMTMQWSRIGPDEGTVTAIATDHQLRLELGELVLVSGDIDATTGTTGADGFAIDGGLQRALTTEERERLRRELTSNPMLWLPHTFARRLEHALLLGGVSVHGRAAFRFELPGDGECEAWLYRDGTPAGFSFRDPLRRARVQWFVGDKALRCVVDGALETGWSGGVRRQEALDETLFRRDA
ncbi:MAG: trypsin-like peptidase domain-containing protein [Planctomycetota bacterium]